MKQVTLIHNPTAGDEERSAEKLIAQLKKEGYTCRHYSTKEEEWKAMEDQPDLLVVAGGDGTVRKVVKQLLKQKKNIPIGLLALGTVNNIAKTFDVFDSPKQVIKSWKKATRKKVDIGCIENVPDVSFFLEGFGFGLFPYLMKEMKSRAVVYDTPEDELKGALKLLHEIHLSYKPHECYLEVDGTNHSGKFYMVEVMNIRSIGSNVVLAPYADPGDGELEVVLIPEAHKDKFADYLLHRLSGGEDTYQFHTLKAKQLKIRYDGAHLHADDKLLKLAKDTEISIEIKEGRLEFLVPEAK